MIYNGILNQFLSCYHAQAVKNHELFCLNLWPMRLKCYLTDSGHNILVFGISYVRVGFAIYGKIIYGCNSGLYKGYSDT